MFGRLDKQGAASGKGFGKQAELSIMNSEEEWIRMR
jgi:hypothetical protein